MLAGAAIENGAVVLRWSDGERRSFRSIWLRDTCGCPACAHPSGQRLLDTASIPAGIAPAAARVEDGSLLLTWPDGHESAFEGSALRLAGAPADRRRHEPWPGHLPEAPHAEVASGTAALRDWLADIASFGYAILRDVPLAEGEVTRVAELFGHVRETNYGRYFDVRSVVEPTNLAYTGLALGAHTDNPYRDPAPTLQLLHCLGSSAEGGDSILTDGFAAAAALREQSPEQFELLAGTPIRFRYADDATDLVADVPVIALDQRGEVAAIHFNNRSKAPLALAEELVEPYYDAYRAFARLLEHPGHQVRFRLQAGDLFVVDNTRVLHGRTGFSGEGERHLQGCYADRDGLLSRLAVLRRSLVDEIFEGFRMHGEGAYLGEPVSLTEHMLQTAHTAERDAAGPMLVAAALLHDYGHFLHDLPEDCAEHGIDSRHEDAGHAFLSRHFVPAAVEPVRLHVAAKRYLCAVEPAYLDSLSPASLLSLELQGGPCDADEVAAFASSPHCEAAVRLRRYDDAGKVEGAQTPGLEHYRAVLEAALK